MSCPWCEYKDTCAYDTVSFCPKWKRDMVEVVYILVALWMMARKGSER